MTMKWIALAGACLALAACGTTREDDSSISSAPGAEIYTGPGAAPPPRKCRKEGDCGVQPNRRQYYDQRVGRYYYYDQVSGRYYWETGEPKY